jgi:hypothetical protein
MNIKTRIEKLEQVATDNEIPQPAIILYVKDSQPTPEQQQQIAEAEKNNQAVIQFTVKDARK